MASLVIPAASCHAQQPVLRKIACSWCCLVAACTASHLLIIGCARPQGSQLHHKQQQVRHHRDSGC
jgi:hypothetical protein